MPATYIKAKKDLPQILFGVGLLVGIYLLVAFAVRFFDISMPPSVVAMALLFSVFVAVKKVPRVIGVGARSLLGIFPLFFIPAGVLVLRHRELILDEGLWFLAAILVSSVLGMATTVGLYRLLKKAPR